MINEENKLNNKILNKHDTLSELSEDLIDIKEYQLSKEDNLYNIIIGKSKSKKYLVFYIMQLNNIQENDFNYYNIKLTLNNLKEKSKCFLNDSIDEAFNIFLQLFDNNKVIINNIIKDYYMKLIFELPENNFEIKCLYKKYNNKNLFLKKTIANIEKRRKSIVNLNNNEFSTIEDKEVLVKKINQLLIENKKLLNENKDLLLAIENSKNDQNKIKDLEKENIALKEELKKYKNKFGIIYDYDNKNDENNNKKNNENNDENYIENNIENNTENNIENIQIDKETSKQIIKNTTSNKVNIKNSENTNDIIAENKTNEIITDDNDTKNDNNILNNTLPIFYNNSLHESLNNNNDFFNNDISTIIQNSYSTNPTLKNENLLDIPNSPLNIKFSKTITQSAFIKYSIDNTFEVFTSLKNNILLVYGTIYNSIECYDLIKKKFIKTILKAHNNLIFTIRYHCSKKFNKEYLLSASNEDNNVKIWDIQTWNCICIINKPYSRGLMFSVCFFFDEFLNAKYICTSSNKEGIKLYDMKGFFIKEINKSNNEIYSINIYYDEKRFKYFLISCNKRNVKSFRMDSFTLYKNYSDNSSICEHVSSCIFLDKGITKMIESEFSGFIRIWNFHSGEMIKKISIEKGEPLVGICLWDSKYLFVGSVNNDMKLVDLNNGKVVKEYNNRHNNEVCCIKKFSHPKFGECLLSQGLANDQIKLWVSE